MNSEMTGLAEAFAARQPEVVAQRALQTRQEVNRVAGGIMPVVGPFRPAAVGAIGGHGQRKRPKRVPQHRAGQVRLVIGDRQRAQAHAPIAHLIPVKAIGGPPALLRVDWQ